MGHFDILLFQTPQDLLKTALEAGAGDCFAGPGTLPGAPGRHDMSCLYFWFGGVTMEEVRKSMPSTLNELKAVVEAFAESVDQEEVKRKRARA